MNLEAIRPTAREYISDLLFNTALGSILMGTLCIFLFVMTLGIGYLGIGMAISARAYDRGNRNGLGLLLAWPIFILVAIVEGKNER